MPLPSSLRSLVNAPTRQGGKVTPGTHPRSSLIGTHGLSRIEPRRRIRRPDTIMGITAPDIRRLARRGGVKRIRKDIYPEARTILRAFLEEILKDCCLLAELRKRKTITVYDVMYAMKRRGKAVWGFDPIPKNFSRKRVTDIR